jgi:hypothetical protein
MAAKAQVRNVTPLVELHADWSSLTSPNYAEGVSSPWRAVGTAIDNIATIKTVLDPIFERSIESTVDQIVTSLR